MPNSIDFCLASFNFDANAIEALYPGTQPGTMTAEVYLEMDVPVSAMQEMFLFHTDAVDFTNEVPDDVLFLLNTVVDLSGVILGSECVIGGTDGSDVTAHVIANSPSINSSANQLVYTAKKIFNICAGVDLFSNEAAFMTTLNTDSQTNLTAELNIIKDAGWSNTSYTNNAVAHPCNVILQNILNASTDRLADLTTYSHADVLDQTAYKLPILVGDSIQFVMTVAAGQNNIADDAIDNRTYRFKLIVVADA